MLYTYKDKYSIFNLKCSFMKYGSIFSIFVSFLSFLINGYMFNENGNKTASIICVILCIFCIIILTLAILEKIKILERVQNIKEIRMRN